jgi:MFS family permease
MGGGGLAALTQIILSDLVPLHERGKFNGLIAAYVYFLTLFYLFLLIFV